MLDYLEFKSPSPQYRPIPFWFWNANLVEDELLEQLYTMADMGVGGAFIHARFGLEAEYLGKEWLRLIRVCCECAKVLGIKLWLYDENPFPSGIGGLKVTSIPEYRAKYLQMDKVPHGEDVPDPDDVIAIYPLETENLVVYRRVLDDPKGKVFGPDYLNPEAMKYFFDTTHEVYAASLGEYFGNVIPGVFTDEPTLLPWHHDLCWYGNLKNRRVVPWSDALPSLINDQGISGDELSSFLISLFDDGIDFDRSAEYRRIYWNTVTRLYKESFAEPYRDWCHRHGLVLTGHLLLEEGLYTNTLFEGNPASILGCFDIPGMDHLGADKEYQYGGFAGLPKMLTNVQGEKLVSSIAHSRGRVRVLSETFGCAGWGLDLAASKRVVDWQFIMGMNMLCPHAFFQSIEGYRKTDAPPSFMHNVASLEFKTFADYTARVSYALSQGVHRASIAVLYPLDAFQSLYRSGSTCGDEKALSQAFDLICSGLLRVQRDYDILDTDVIGAADVVDGRLSIQNEEFTVVIVPKVSWLPDTTLDKLVEFKAAGGKVIEVYIASVQDSEAYYSQNPGYGCDRSLCLGSDIESAVAVLRQELCDIAPDIALDPPSPDILYIERYIPESRETVLFIINTSSEPYSGTLRVNAEGGLREWNPETGEVSGMPGRREGFFIHCRLTLPGNGSALYSASPDYPVVEETGESSGPLSSLPSVLLGSPWKFEIMGKNVMPLDNWRTHFSNYNGGEDYRYTTSFHADFIPDDLQLLLDDIEYRDSYMGGMDLAVTINGRSVDCRFLPFNLDRRLKLLDIAEYVSKGSNEIELVIRHSCWSGQPRTLTGAPKLLGGFVLSSDRHLIEPLGVLTTSELTTWTKAGYPYYSGTARYEAEFALDSAKIIPGERSWVEVVGWVAGSFRLWINGVAVGARAWGPWVIDFDSSLLRTGCNNVVLEVTNTSQNFMESVPRESGIIGSVLLRIGEDIDESFVYRQ